MPEGNRFRIISSEMITRDEDKDEHAIDLLDDGGVKAVFELRQTALKAIAFLQRDNVDVRAILNSFCHAKVYLFDNDMPQNNSFYLTGSSNLTDAGLGLRVSSNVELNIGESCDKTNLNFNELHKWYELTWRDAQKDIARDPSDRRSQRITIKQHFIEKINEHFREYSPEQIYYKMLFEMFGNDLELDENTLEHKQDMNTLRGSVIWRTLFDYQQKGVISLIKMLRRHNGAILADAVGLGKTFSALAVIKYFSTQGYTTLLLCPKKLENNWTQYLKRRGSRFERDEFDYVVRFHTDLQGDRLEEAYNEAKLSFLHSRQKLLVVIDESHNLRNEKSGRYKYLLENIIAPSPEQPTRQVKVLMLSATPINNGLNDIKGQFKLIAQGLDNAFDNDDFSRIGSLDTLFRDSNTAYKKWTESNNRNISDFIRMLPDNFFHLTDRLIVARTRSLIEHTLNENLGFPKKDKPQNVYLSINHIGHFSSVDSIYEAFDKLCLTAYMPSLYLPQSKQIARQQAKSDWTSDVFREQFLVKMMGILFMKRLESSWHSCMLTIRKVHAVHVQTLAMVDDFIAKRNKADTVDTDTAEIDEDDLYGNFDIALHKGTVHLSDMQNLGGFRKGLQADVKQLSAILEAFEDFQTKYRNGQEHDDKLDRLADILRDKARQPCRKVIIFTVYADTAHFLFSELQRRGFERIASVSGQEIHTTGRHNTRNFNDVLESFAPQSKLYKERDWSDLYAANLNRDKYYDADRQQWNVDYDLWQQLIRRHRPNIAAKLDDPIDILIATDCLSEGQNLQDADLQINYDIHWNPVRLIQRLGRIDRIGSPHDTVRCINFWPSQSFDEYLRLVQRVENRMAVMTAVGTEVASLTEEFDQRMKDNPLLTESEVKLLQQMQDNSITDIEEPQTLSLADLSLETFRQDLREYFERHKEEFRRMPPGVFSGFRVEDNLFESTPECLVALLGYPKRNHDQPTPKPQPYTDFYLMSIPVDNSRPEDVTLLNATAILTFLRNHKSDQRFVPQAVDHGEPQAVGYLVDAVDKWMKANAPKQTEQDLFSLFNSDAPKGGQLTDAKFKKENFDLIAWDYITKQS